MGYNAEIKISAFIFFQKAQKIFLRVLYEYKTTPEGDIHIAELKGIKKSGINIPFFNAENFVFNKKDIFIESVYFRIICYFLVPTRK